MRSALAIMIFVCSVMNTAHANRVDMKSIPVVVNVLVDDEDFDRVSQISWSHHQSGYAYGYDRAVGKNVSMHRLVMGAGEGDIIDHINRKPWDNRKENLRFANKQINALNVEAAKSKLKAPRIPQSPYKGVHYLTQRDLWGVQFRGERVGEFTSDREAAVAYDEAARKSGIEGVWLNFPDGVVTGPETVVQRKREGRGSSRYIGISFNNHVKKWQTTIRLNGKNFHGGFFDDEREAALMYDAIARAAKGDKAFVNFTDERIDLPFHLDVRMSRKGYKS